MSPAYTFLILGAPGLGKSSIAGSICEIVPPKEVLLLVTKPGEEKSWRYQEYGLTERAELFYDDEWLPDLDLLKGVGYKQLIKRLHSLRTDEQYGAVIIDPGTDVMRLIEHFILQPYGVGSAGDLKDTRSYYASLKDKAQTFVAMATALASTGARPKHVIIPWHLQPIKEGDPNVESSDQKAQGYEYAGKVLPMMEGSYRRKLQADVDFVLYADVEIKPGLGSRPQVTRYVVQPQPSKEKHAKVRAAPVLQGTYDNNFKALFAAIEEAKNAND